MQQPGFHTVVQRLGPAFALLVPTTVVIETQPPASALHPQTHDLSDVVGPGTAAIFILVVVLVIVAERVVAWVVRASEGSRD